jgi:phosphinothricin acetyltransferase
LVVRSARAGDLPALVEVYNHHVLTPPITFDVEAYSAATRTPWFEQFAERGRHRLFVAELGSRVVGYASSTRFHAKAAYDTSVECSAYVAHDCHGQGVGGALYDRLFAELAAEPVHRIYAGITQPNAASVALHERFGFRLSASYHEVGFKLGRYWDVCWYEKRLS